MFFILSMSGLVIGGLAGFYFQRALKKKEAIKLIIFLILGIVSLWMIWSSQKFFGPDFIVWIPMAAVISCFIVPPREKKKDDGSVKKYKGD